VEAASWRRARRWCRRTTAALCGGASRGQRTAASAALPSTVCEMLLELNLQRLHEHAALCRPHTPRTASSSRLHGCSTHTLSEQPQTEDFTFDPFPDLPADFGPEIPEDGIDGWLVVRFCAAAAGFVSGGCFWCGAAAL